jgi:UDP-glucose 4-epimerase
MPSAPAIVPGCYLVTGGAGFIGSHLADALLAAGHGVRVLDDLSTGRIENLDPRCELIRADVADLDAVLRAMNGASGCFHLAAIASVARSNEDWLGTHRANQTGTITVLECARRLGRVPVVYASSAAVYGDTGPEPISELRPPAPLTAYGADKLGSELHASVAHHVHGVPTFGLRFFNVYGPRQDPLSPYSGVISIFARQVADRQPICLHGDGGQTRDFVYVADVVEHLLAAMACLQTQGGSEVRNVCTGRATTVAALAALLGDLHGDAAGIVAAPARLGATRHSRGDPVRTAALLGLRADTELRAGLQRLLRSAP